MRNSYRNKIFGFAGFDDDDDDYVEVLVVGRPKKKKQDLEI